ncbi:MFS transporter [Salipiger sp. PrR002]|uniref:MFS transporter n=1 Tax=Salipiger sp. PrR002 TaxID=2706489 RepID=UPI0013BE42C1|nr:MFS transporter [Salipiger sp. PrR002]NDW00313.1 MFS transporter [Salipiger sp. PrR002]NDW58368.1 MFS transporter [Salipiger sp. PrR004]
MSVLSDLRMIRAPLAGFAGIGVCWGVFAGSVPVVMAQTGLGDGGFATAMLISTCGAIAAMWLAPWAEERLRRWAMPVFIALLACGFALPGLATSGVQFGAIMLCCAAAAGTVDVAMNAQLSHLEAKSGRPLMNLAHGGYSLVYACAALTAGIARGAGLPLWSIFMGAAVVTLAMALVARGGAALPHHESAEPGSDARGPLPWAVVVLAGVVICIGFLAEQATEAWSALHLERNLGAGAVGGALAPTLLGLTMGAGRLAGQGVIGRLNGAGVLGAGAALAAFGALVAALAPTALIGWAGFAVLGFGVSVLAPMAYAWLGGRLTPQSRARAISRATVIGYAGFFLGPPLMGGLSEVFGLRAAFGAVALLLLAVPLVLLPLMARR